MENTTLDDEVGPPAGTQTQTMQRRLLFRAGEFAVMPTVARQALEIAKNPDCSITEFANVAQRDVKLAADLLKVSNSVLFSPAKPVVSLTEAVIRLGFRQCKNLIEAASISSLMQRLSLDQRWLHEMLCRHGLLTAVNAVHLNRALSLGFQGEEFTGGLIHDIGRLLLALAAGQEFYQADPLDFDEQAGVLERESAILETNHCHFGAWFVKRSGVPQSIVEVVKFHHAPAEAMHNTMLVAVVAAADHMANHLQRCTVPQGYRPEENEGVRCLVQAGVPFAMARFREMATDLLEVAANDVREMSHL